MANTCFPLPSVSDEIRSIRRGLTRKAIRSDCRAISLVSVKRWIQRGWEVARHSGKAVSPGESLFARVVTAGARPVQSSATPVPFVRRETKMATVWAVMPEANEIWGAEEEREDQRSRGRYPIALELQYKLLHGGRVVKTGSGRTLNISSGGVLCQTDAELPARGSVEVAMKWPFLLGGDCGLKLVMRGRIVRSDATTKAIAIRADSHEFRTAGKGFIPRSDEKAAPKMASTTRLPGNAQRH